LNNNKSGQDSDMKTFNVTIVLALLLSIGLPGCNSGDKPSGAPGAGMQPLEVDVVKVTTGSATITQDLPGRLQAFRTAEVRARVEGIIERRLFEEGSDVKEGASLFQIDPAIYKAAAESAQADWVTARQTVERYKPLLEINAVSQQEFDLAEAKAKQTESAAVRADQDLLNASVPAAISGRIGRTAVTEGAFVGKGEATLLATIEQLDPIYANFTQSGNDLLRLKQAIKSGKLQRAESAKVELLLEDGSVYPLAGKIFFTDMAVDPGTGSVSLRAQFPNPQRELLPGMFVRIRFPQAVAENSLLVPQRAVQAGPQGQLVMIVDSENKVTPVPVKTGGMVGENFIVNEGLKQGERVIVNGLQKIRPGAVVKPVLWDATAQPSVAKSAEQK